MYTPLEGSDTKSSQVTVNYILLYFQESLHVKDTLSPIDDWADRDPGAAFGDVASTSSFGTGVCVC